MEAIPTAIREADRRHYYPDDVVNVIIQDLQDSNLAETGENNVYIETYPPGDGTRVLEAWAGNPVGRRIWHDFEVFGVLRQFKRRVHARAK
ncbi:hypothetical protein SASPL_135145 [Salvia splendens]|uniref:Uncharacterized protein n=1 Tax=Salvia splendens TaxID=180675 RepID=A0A8X8WZK8_SALSN|nr:hypothetical protein SASPL_135145 [Salvia splendens]